MKIFTAKNSLATLATLFGTIAYGAVAQSGAWTAASTWSEGSVPTATSASPLTDLKFAAANLNLTVDSNVYVRTITSSTDTITINSGSSLNLVGMTSATAEASRFVLTSAATTDSLTFNGAGTLNLALTANNFISKGTFTFNTEVSHTGSGVFFSNSTVNINGGWAGKTDIALHTFATLNINSNMSVTRFNAWGNSSKTNVAEGAKLTSSSGFAMTNGVIDGEISNTGSTSEYYNVSFGRRNDGSVSNIVFGSKAKITSTSTNWYTQIRNCTLTVNSATSSFKTATNILLTDSKITMNTSNVFNVAGKSQGESAFMIGRIDTDQKTLIKSNGTFTLNANNDFGTFTFVGASTLKFTTNGHKMTIGGFILYDADSSVAVTLDKLTDFTVKINSIDNIETETDSDGNIRAVNVLFLDSDEYTDSVFVVEDTANGGWWLNASAAPIPEPAALAAMLAALALGIAVYRRRA